MTSSWWLPSLSELVIGSSTSPAPAEPTDPHAGHHHDHSGHDESESVELSPQARKNINLKTGEIQLSDYARTITVPAMVTERPGETTFQIAAPLTGVVAGLSVVRGEAVQSGKLLFTLRLTHEDIVQAQTEYLRLLGQLEVEQKELARLQQVNSGAIARKVLLERQYEVNKIEAQLKAQGAALQLHGLSKEQVQAIAQNRELLRDVKDEAPLLHDDRSMHNHAEPLARHPQSQTAFRPASQSSTPELPHDLNSRVFVVQTLGVHTGEAVKAGQMLCVLVDYSNLYVEGRAFAQDADQIVEAANQNRSVVAIPERYRNTPVEIKGLDIAYVSNEVERDSRALHFYVNLPNRVVRQATNLQGRHFLTWHYRPGQRMQIRVPVETWKNVIKLPVDAIAEEGPERFVFVENGDHFDRRPVHVMY
ncbi:MAG: efflux RND transporter periplasmic adaptor subunit, partial [Planctomycetaceae bacterium]|nr:efflux RND transporter periplasmic adaptor subunit [Planctomycetaceae bacterium]